MRGQPSRLGVLGVGIVSAQCRPVVVGVEVDILIHMLPQRVKDLHPIDIRRHAAINIPDGLPLIADVQLFLQGVTQQHTAIDRRNQAV